MTNFKKYFKTARRKFIPQINFAKKNEDWDKSELTLNGQFPV